MKLHKFSSAVLSALMIAGTTFPAVSAFAATDTSTSTKTTATIFDASSLLPSIEASVVSLNMYTDANGKSHFFDVECTLPLTTYPDTDRTGGGTNHNYLDSNNVFIYGASY